MFFIDPMNKLVEIYNCDCNPQFTYKTKQSFKNHFKSAHHHCWELQRENRNYREKIVELENHISSIKVERNMWKDMAIRLKRQHEPVDLLLD